MRWKHIALMLLVVGLNVGGKTWRDIPKHYKTLCYVMIVHTLYYKLCKRHLVWDFTPLNFNWTILRTIHILIVTPLLVLLFLSKLPNTLYKRMCYLVKWVIYSSGVEYISHKQKLIQYRHGWNIFWSGLLYLMMYVYSFLFTKRPWLTCILTICSIIFFIFKFKVPIKSKHPFSRKIDSIVNCFYFSKLEDIV